VPQPMSPFFKFSMSRFLVPSGTRNLLARAVILIPLFLSGLLGGTARAQTPTNTVTRTITIQLDQRYGLHLHNNSWTVHLGGGLGTGPGSSVSTSNCYRAGAHNLTTGRDELYTTGTAPSFLNLFNFARFSGDTVQDAANPYSQAVNLEWFSDAASTTPETRIVKVSSYPGFEVVGGVLQWKGPIMCILNTTLEVFSNQQTAGAGNGVNRSRVQATLSVPNPTRFPKLVLNVSNTVTPGANAAFVNPNGTTAISLGTRTNPVRWVDFPLIQALVFDGTETAASSGTATLTFTLADFSPIP
jgi:hypothetical protein